jgi:hypothetical protein
MLWLAIAARAQDPASTEPVAPPVESAPAPEAPPPVLDLTPQVPSDLVFDARAPLLALAEGRYSRVRKSTAVLLVVSGFEVGPGVLMCLSEACDGGAWLFLGGLVHVAQAWYQLDYAQRRHAAMVADLTYTVDRPEAWEGIARSARFSAEREARAHAYAAGLYSGIVATGVSLLIADSEDAASARTGVAFTTIGLVGFVHHVSRWRASVRVGTDLDSVVLGAPTVVPDGG